MEVGINIGERKKYQINNDITFDEMENQGYFYVHSTEKIIVMNDTSYFLWKCILRYAENKQQLTGESLWELFKNHYYFDEEDKVNFINDMKTSINHFVNEKFLKVV